MKFFLYNDIFAKVFLLHIENILMVVSLAGNYTAKHFKHGHSCEIVERKAINKIATGDNERLILLAYEFICSF